MPTMVKKNDKLARIADAILKNKNIERPKGKASNGPVTQPATSATRVMSYE